MAQCICLQLTNKLLLTHPPTFPEKRDKDLSKVNGGPLLNRNWNLSFRACGFGKSRRPLDGSKQGKTAPHSTQLLIRINGGFTFFTSKSHSPTESFIWRTIG